MDSENFQADETYHVILISNVQDAGADLCGHFGARVSVSGRQYYRQLPQNVSHISFKTSCTLRRSQPTWNDWLANSMALRRSYCRYPTALDAQMVYGTVHLSMNP